MNVFDVASARESAAQGKLHEWVEAYRAQPDSANAGLPAIIRYQKPVLIGPIEVTLSQIERSAGPEPEMRYRKPVQEWEQGVAAIISSLRAPTDLPPMIVRATEGKLWLPDGNHRHEAMVRLGWSSAWTLIWCDREERFERSWRSRD